MTHLLFKKTCLIFGSVLFLAAFAQAQGTSFGIRAGVNFQNITGRDATDDKLENELATKFHAGVQADIPIAPQFYFQPGLLFSMKGAKGEINLFEETINTNLSISYLELPLSFVFKPELGNGRIILGAGPYVAYGVGGKIKFESGDNDETEDIKFENEVTLIEATQDFYVKRFDAGANLFFGYEFNAGLFFQVNTQLGLLDISPDYENVEDDDTTYQNTGFGLSVGYNF